MTQASPDFDHSALNIPGVTLPEDPTAAAHVLRERVQAALQSSRPSLPHAEVMHDMRARITQAARG